jgi:hypothetical protein
MIRVRVNGAEQTVSRFAAAGADVKLRLQSSMEYLGGELAALMRSNADIGLDEKTGRLARSFFNRVAVRLGGETFVLTVGLTRRAFYGGFQDRGIPAKTVDVRGYSRGVKGRDTREGRRRMSSGVGFVSAYRRQMHLDETPFIGRSLEQMESDVLKQIENAVYGGIG